MSSSWPQSQELGSGALSIQQACLGQALEDLEGAVNPARSGGVWAGAESL